MHPLKYFEFLEFGCFGPSPERTPIAEEFFENALMLKSAWHVRFLQNDFYEVSWESDFDRKNLGDILHGMVFIMAQDLNCRPNSFRKRKNS